MDNDDLDLLLGLDPSSPESNTYDDPSLLTNLNNKDLSNNQEDPYQHTSDPNLNSNEDENREEGNEDGEGNNPPPPVFDLITEALKSRGFKDPDNIKIETDLGIITKSFNDLTDEEKLQILNTSPEENFELASDEISLVSFMRENELNQDTLIEYFKQLGVQEYLDTNTKMQVDNLTDDELFALDINNRYEDLTEEEVHEEVERAKENPTLFAKKVDKLRELYKEIEKQELEAQSTQEQTTPEQTQKFYDDFKSASSEYKNLGGIDLEESDVTSTYDYAFKPTVNGFSKMGMDLNDPKRLFKMAFLMSHGDELLQNLHTVYRNALKEKDMEINKLKGIPSNPKNNAQKSTLASVSNTSPIHEDLKALLKFKK